MMFKAPADIEGVRLYNYSISPPISAYRFFREEAHAEALARGDVWLTTLEDCRHRELADGGDPDEGLIRYSHDDIAGHTSDPAIRETLRRLGLPFEEGDHVTLEGNVSINRVPDAWVLCMTSKFAPEKMQSKYGTSCVEIGNTIELMFQITHALLEAGAQLRSVAHGYVHYRDLTYKNLEPMPRQPGFMKWPDQYRDENEYRIIWWPTLDAPQPPMPRLLKGAVHKSRFRRLR